MVFVKLYRKLFRGSDGMPLPRSITCQLSSLSLSKNGFLLCRIQPYGMVYWINSI